MGKLYIVATPIGNLGDMTYRGVETLKSVDFIICEDTRHAKILLERYEIDKERVSFHAQSDMNVIQKYVQRIEKGESAAYISDAGTPGISDPGYRLVVGMLNAGIEVIPIPGASALTTLVSVAGIPVNSFTFHGFLPHKKGRQTLLKSCKDAEKAQIFYESVHRFPRLLDELAEYVGLDREIVVGRELTKMHEDIFRGTVKEAQEYYTSTNTKGEFVIIIRGQ